MSYHPAKPAKMVPGTVFTIIKVDDRQQARLAITNKHGWRSPTSTVGDRPLGRLTIVNHQNGIRYNVINLRNFTTELHGGHTEFHGGRWKYPNILAKARSSQSTQRKKEEEERKRILSLFPYSLIQVKNALKKQNLR